jgi:hypothetical protein
MLNLGGIDNRPPKANQTMGRFRVARNVYPTPDGRLIPRYDWGRDLGQPANIKTYHHISNYKNQPLSIVSQNFTGGGLGNEVERFLLGITPVPMAGYIGVTPYTTGGVDPNKSPMSYMRNSTTYMLTPWDRILSKYDGVQVWPCGAPQPITTSAQAKTTAASLLSNDKYIRIIQHTTDFDNTDVASEFVEFAVANATTIVNIRTDGGTNIIGTSKVVSPQNKILESSQSRLYFLGSGSYNVGTQDYSISGTDTNITSTQFIGAYVYIGIQQDNVDIDGSVRPVLGFAMKVKSVSPLVLDALDVKYLDPNREWITADAVSPNLAGTIASGTQTFFSAWKSSSKTGVYYYAGFYPSFPYFTGTSLISPVPTTSVVLAEDGSADLIVALGPVLNDIYDTTTRKLSPNSAIPFGLDSGLTSLTAYQDLLLLASDDIIWLSDPTLGGSFEQLNTSSFIRVGDTEFGKITSICGTQDFLVVCRETKNYYVTGNLVTGNYKVQEIIEAEVGAWSNNCSINVKDSVIFLTAIGVFQVVSGGKASKLSETCPKNFESYDPMNVNEDVSFKMSGFTSDITNVVRDGISVAYDEYRELLVFMKKGIVNNPCLVIHTKTGEIYEWDGMMWGYATKFSNCMAFIQAKFYMGQVETDATTYESLLVYENKALLAGYMTSNPVKLYTSWLTAGEPSLEKSLLQLKIFGRIETSGSSKLQVAHYKDWDINTKITNTTYEPILKIGSISDQIQYSHKQRLNSDKVLAASVGIEINNNQTSFEIEAFEVEFNPIQSGMKK